jgi:uncharacterized protein with von Willebrand factor type A (vWA) domain
MCSPELRTALDRLDALVVAASDDIYWDTRKKGWFDEVRAAVEVVYATMRKELDIT